MPTRKVNFAIATSSSRFLILRKYFFALFGDRQTRAGHDH
jgi:hypothetical protein